MTRHWKDEEGASLILVIIFTMIFAIVIAAVLDFATTGFKTTEEIVGIRNQQHAVDGAMDGAINSLRRTGFGTDGNPCPDYTYDSATDGDPTVVVTCTIDTESGEGNPDDEVPEYAVLTGLWADPSAACDGFIQTGNEEMVVRGGIFSNGRIAINEYDSGASCGNPSGTGEMAVIWGNAFAVGKCSWWSTVAKPDPKITPFLGVRECELGNDDIEAAPAYLPNYDTAAEVAAAPGAAGYDPLPDCTSADTVTFSPGVYTEVPTYHFDRANCSGDIWYFEPGTYYFDFPADDALWAVNPYNIIGGTLKTGLTLSGVASSWDSRTDFHICDDDPYTTSPGVQFIFGGPSRISTQSDAGGKSGVVNLCGGKSPTLFDDPTSPMKQRLVMYALQPSQDNRPDPETESFENGSDPTSAEFLLPAKAKSPDGASATRVFSPATKDASISFDGFDDLPVDGVTVTSVTAKIRHYESSNKLDPKLTLHYDSDASGNGTTIDLGSAACDVTGTITGDDNLPLSVEECTIDFLEDPFLWREINSLSATYTIPDPKLKCTGKDNTNCESATALVDSVEIEVEYQEAGFEPQVSTEPFLSTTNNPVALFEGTFFAPYADLSINVHNSGTTEFARGVIANHIKGQASASSKQTTAPFRLPDNITVPVVILEARVDGKPRLRTRIGLEAGDATFGRQVHIYDWTVVRGS